MGRRSRSQKDRKAAAPKQPIDREFTIAIGLSAIALWACFPPLDFGWLAWLAPAGWLVVARRKSPISRRGWWALWLSGLAFWLPTLQGIRLAYWPLYFGWIAMSLALAAYTPLFILLTRRLTTRLSFPFFLAAPTAWVGVEFLRSWVLTGFCGNGLSHSQVAFPSVIQIADQLGAYGISFLVMLVCAAVVQTVQDARRAMSASKLALPIAIAIASIGTTLAYGRYRLTQADELARGPDLLEALLVQENTPTMFDGSKERLQDAWNRYLNTTRKLALKHGIVDLVVWPESTFGPYIAKNRPSLLPDRSPAMPRQQVEANVSALDNDFRARVLYTLRASRGEPALGTGAPAADLPEAAHLLVGSGTVEITEDEDRNLNSALFISPEGHVIGRYDKMHAVMFGEYIPFGPLLKPLRDIFPITIFEGEAPVAFSLGEATICPNICFESMVPRLVSRQVRTLTAEGKSPDVIVNMSNDSWFRGSSMLDHHLACTVLSAVENRRPVIVAANTGLSASIDGSGRVLQRTNRLEATGILARPTADARPGLVQSLGYPLAWITALLCIVAFFRPQPSHTQQVAGNAAP